VIRSFVDRNTEEFFFTGRSRRFSSILAVGFRKLQAMDKARELSDLRHPPGNRLEALKGNRVGQHSIRINDQFCICFVWKDGAPELVEIVDYH
jgi:proteic killer suppression protein